MDQHANLAADWLALKMTRRFAAPPEALFRAWLEPDQLAQWFGAPGRKTHVERLEARVGGTYRISFSGGDMPTNTVLGSFEEIAAPSRLVFTWVWEAGPAGLPTEATLVTVTFRAVGQETEMTLTHAGFDSREWRDRHEHGWTCGFDNLAELLAA